MKITGNGEVAGNDGALSVSDDGSKFEVAGGTYSSDVNQYCAAGYYAKKTGESEWTVEKGVTLSKVEIENTTCVITVDGNEYAAKADGSYVVPSNAVVTITYKATDDYMFESGGTEMFITLEADKFGGNYAMTDEDKESVTKNLVEHWIDGATGRVIAIDTCERIVITSPDQVLPIAYSTNIWGQVTDGVKVDLGYQRPGEAVNFFFEDSVENGYYEWTPEEGDYGEYPFFVHSTDGAGDGNWLLGSIYYTTSFQLTWSQVEHGTIAVTNADDGVELTSGTNVLGYSSLTLTATPENRYEFTGWTITTNDVAWTNIEDAVTTIEMPNAATAIAGGFQWKTNYDYCVEVKDGEVWEVFEGETYEGGINAKEGATVTFRDSVSNISKLKLTAGATNVWDFTESGSPCFGDFSKINPNEGIEMISFDKTLKKGNYTIASGASSANGKTFLISNGSSTVEITVVSKSALDNTNWVNIGGKRFKLYVDGNALHLSVDYSGFYVTYEALGGSWTDGETSYTFLALESMGYEFPVPDPTREDYRLIGWYDSWTNSATQITNGMDLIKSEDHTLYAKWESTTIPAEKGEQIFDIGSIPAGAEEVTITKAKKGQSVTDSAGRFAVPDRLSNGDTGVAVTKIDEAAFAKKVYTKSNITSLRTSLYLTEIGEGAFNGITSLTNLYITPACDYRDPTKAVETKIGKKAFAGTGLENIYIPETVTDIGISAFQNCSKLKKIVFGGDAAVTYGQYAFYRCAWNNGDKGLKIYMSKEFQTANSALISAINEWNTEVKIYPKVGVAQLKKGEEATIGGIDFASLGTDRIASVSVKIPIEGTGIPDIDIVKIQYKSDLGATDWTDLTPSDTAAFEDGTVLIEFKVPEGNSGYFKVLVEGEEN